jgi:hypothetical protein
MRTGCLLPRGLLYGGLAVSLIALAGCAGENYLDPYQKPYTWHPTGASAANLAAQVVDPHDLVAGRGTTGEDTQQSTAAIQHIWTDTPKPFITEGGGSSGGGSAGGTGASGSGPGASGGSAGGSGGSSGGSN